MARRKIFILILIFYLSFFSLFFANNCFAVNGSLYLAPSSDNYTVNNTFSIDVRVNTGEAAINAAQGSLVFSTDQLEVVSISKTGSIFSLWTTEPNFSNSSGAINFAGGAPSPGYSGASGKIITIVFRSKLVGDAAVNFSSGAVLANDGKGTNILTGMGGGKYAISPKVIESEIKPAPASPKVEIKEDKEAVKFFDTAPLVITSLTHPEQGAWYNINDIIFKWDLPYGATGVSILLNEIPESNPGSVSDGLFSVKEYGDVEDGIWYFHLKIKAGSAWSEISHFKVQIDAKPPEPFKISVIQKEKAVLPFLYFKTTDDGSGIDRYEIKISGQDFIFKPSEDTFQIPVLLPGKHSVIIKAIDKAGNETIAAEDIVIEPIEAPVIKNYLRELKSSGQFFAGGTALPNADINIFIQSENKDKTITRAVKADSNGAWHLFYSEGLSNGEYFAWAEAKNSQGMKSNPSNKISFLVSPPIFIKIGSLAIDYFTVFVILLIFFVLVISFLSYWAGAVRNKLKKETEDVQTALHNNLKTFKQFIAGSHAYLRQDSEISEEEAKRAKNLLKEKVDAIEKKISKEIKDIKDLLK